MIEVGFWVGGGCWGACPSLDRDSSLHHTLTLTPLPFGLNAGPDGKRNPVLTPEVQVNVAGALANFARASMHLEVFLVYRGLKALVWLASQGASVDVAVVALRGINHLCKIEAGP